MTRTVLVALLGVHALPYRKRRSALDKSYGDRPSATTTSDTVVVLFSFLSGVWIGATLIQLYFQFHVPVPEDRAAPPVVFDQIDVIRHPGFAVATVAWCDGRPAPGRIVKVLR
jgi:hypothetical protein